MRRTRSHAWIRDLVQEHAIRASDLIWPVFVQEGKRRREPIASMPGVSRFSVEELTECAVHASALGIAAIALFPVVEDARKDDEGSEALRTDNLACSTIKALKQACPDLGIIADVALDPYTRHGQDGVLIEGRVDNDATVEALVAQALVLADAGADVVAPSDMMDGRVQAIRHALEQAGHVNTLILSYAAKYASSFYGPFREAVGSAAALASKRGGSDKRSYQMNPANGDEALREVALDIQEGADMVMIKPGLPYLDIVHRVKTEFRMPTLVYQVSGEYAMWATAAEAGHIGRMETMMESMLCFKRAGADGVLTYAAVEIAEHLAQQRRE